MARMYPQRLPDFVESSAERLLYEQFASQLPNSFVVMHSVKWLIRDRRHHDHDGEVDFLIAHPDLGLLVLEVKGGRIRIDGSTGHWYTMDRFEHESQLKASPFDQVQRNLYSLRAKLEETPKTKPYHYRLQRGVALPDVNVGQTDIGLYGDRDLIIDSTDLPRLEAAIRRIMGMPDIGDRSGTSAVNALVDLLQPTLEINRIGLASQILSNEQRIASLTEIQFAVLDALQERERAAISGCAGSGKTMLAMEKARRLANEGFSVLFTCFNKHLARWVREQFDRDPYTPTGRIHVSHYHGLVLEMCRYAGITLPTEPVGDSLKEREYFFNAVLPEKLQEALVRLPMRFDAIVADEGQDFAELWWLTLLNLLRDEEHGVFYIFYDNNQRIYSREAALPIPDLPYTLSLNCRNTERIHQFVLLYYQGTPRPHSHGPIGIAPEVVPVVTNSDHESLRRVFTKLFTEEKLSPSTVVVLTPRSSRTSTFKEGERIGNMVLTWNDQPAPGQVRVSSIYSFKGLESPVVILVELDKIEHDQQDYLLYVGVSRPRDHLIVLGQLPSPATMALAPQDTPRWLMDEE